MACKDPSQNLLETEFSFLKQKFPKSHNLFVLSSHSEEETCMLFLPPDTTRIRFQVNFLPGYPKEQPIWTVDNTEVQSLATELNTIANGDGNDAYCPLVSKCVYIITRLCAKYNIQPPEGIQGMVGEFCELYKPGEREDPDSGEGLNGDEDYDDEYEDYGRYEDVADFFPEDDMTVSDANSDWNERDVSSIDAGISVENRDFLEKMRIQSYKTSTTGEDNKNSDIPFSAITSDRLLKELRDIYKSQAYKDKVYDVTINDDNLYSWEIELFKVDEDSALHKDLIKLAEKNKDNSIRIHVTFTSTYPYEPPFVRIISPVLQGGFVFPSGALCMELLTPQGWSSAYSLESVILQVSATMSKGGARVNFDSDASHLYSMHSAQTDFKMIVKCHKEGWYTPPPDEG